jgi:hypothetical protein
VIPPKSLCFEKEQGKQHKDNQGNNFLHHLKFDETEWASIPFEPYFISRHLKTIFKQSNSPANEYDADERQRLEPFYFLELQMSIPGKGHKHIAQNQEEDGVKCLHFI